MPSTTIKYFAFAHLPQHLHPVSGTICDIAHKMEALLLDGPEKSAGMRKLLEAKDCFVRAALEKPKDAAPASTLPPHQQRVVDEHAELDLKTTKLAAFFGTPIYNSLPDAEQARLVKQLEVMHTYCGILQQRIESFATV